MKRVEDEIERVGLAELKSCTRSLIDERRVCRLEADDADVQVRVVVQKTNFGPLPRRLAGPRRHLDEVGGRARQLPARFFEAAVERDLFGDADRRDQAALPDRLVVDRSR